MIWLVLAWLAAEGDVVRNGMAPKGKAVRLVFTEDLRFGGGDEDDHYIWSSVNPTLSVDGEGRFYVANPAENQILVFDRDGNFVRTMGGEGEGPGMYLTLNLFTVLQDGTARGFDTFQERGRVTQYDAALKFVRNLEAREGSVFRLHFSPDGRFAGAQYLRSKGNQVQVHWGVIGENLEPVHSMFQMTLERWNNAKAQDPAYLRQRAGEIMAMEMGPRAILGFGDKGQIFSANTDAYIIKKWDPNMKQAVLAIEKAYKPKLISEEEIEGIVDDWHSRYREMLPSLQDLITRDLIRKGWEGSGIKPVHQPLMGLIVLPDGHLLAVLPNFGEGRQEADLFDPDGKLIGTAINEYGGFWDTDGKPRMIFRGAYAYAMETVDGDHQAVRYRYEVR